tara:strand:- start:735 stop:1097 length:363 start_codon:yes stop_codon:yes gene_type:complete
MEFIWVHFLAAVLAIILGLINLVSEKGTPQHRMVGWFWLITMIFVTVPSFWIREINDGDLSWIHLLTIWTIISMGIAILSIKRGYVRTHAGFMAGTMLGAVIAGGFAMMPGRFISLIIGY